MSLILYEHRFQERELKSHGRRLKRHIHCICTETQ